MAAGRIKKWKEGNGESNGECSDSNPEAFLVREALVSRAALEDLCDLYVPRIYNYVLKRVGRVPDAEDITSTVFEKVLMNLDRFDENKASFSTWIYRITINSVTDYYRLRGRRKETSIEEARPVDFADSGGIDGLDSQILVIELMRSLPTKYQEALALRYFAGMSVMEVAETLGITETAASKRILRGLEQMRRTAPEGLIEEYA